MRARAGSFEAEYAQYERDWEGVPNMTRNAFGRWWHDAFSPQPVEPWFPPFHVAAALPDTALLHIRQIGRSGVRAIRTQARVRAEAP